MLCSIVCMQVLWNANRLAVKNLFSWDFYTLLLMEVLDNFINSTCKIHHDRLTLW